MIRIMRTAMPVNSVILAVLGTVLQCAVSRAPNQVAMLQNKPCHAERQNNFGLKNLPN